MVASGRDRKGWLTNRYITVGGVVLLGGIVIAAGMFSFLLGMRIAVRGSETSVPELRGETLDQVRQTLESRGLEFRVLGERYDDSVAKGGVLYQKPDYNAAVKPGGVIQVVLSLGPRVQPVPDLRGVSLRVARLRAAQAGYQVGYVSEIPATEEQNERVLQQFPAPETDLATSPRIDLLVGEFLESQYVMPHVRGRNLSQVVSFFERKGFKLSPVQYVSVSGKSRGEIVKQFPEGGSVLNDNDPIFLAVAR